jgi:hypothetical protein
MLRFLQRKISLGKNISWHVIDMLWFGLSLITTVSELLRGVRNANNYQIFKNVFYHTLAQTNLFAPYPDAHFDTNHYGIVFSLFIAPFALMPDWLGCFCWCMSNAALLWYAIRMIPADEAKKTAILGIILIELQTSLHNTQFNPMMAAFILLAFLLTYREKEWAAAFFILAGFYIKIYGIVALSAFFFSRHKPRFIGWCLIWAVVLFCLPMLFSSPAFTIDSYADWLNSLTEKNDQNTSLGIVFGQNISAHGMLQRIFDLPGLSQLWILIPAACIQLIPLVRFRQWKSAEFILLYAASCLIATTIFSSSAESATYVIAVTGAAIWYVYSTLKGTWRNAILIFLFLFTILSPTDLYPECIKRGFFVAYSLKALPCLLIWVLIAAQLIRHNFAANIPKEDA